MKRMLGSVVSLFVISAGAASLSMAQSLPATDVLAEAIRATLQEQTATGRAVVDTPIRTVDAGGHHVGIGLVRRTGPAQGGSAAHDKVTEVYYIMEGSGTLVTGGSLVNPERRQTANATVQGINGPGVSGTQIANGVSRRITKGDMVIIPAGTPHWWSSVDTPEIYYIVVRVDPDRVVALK